MTTPTQQTSPSRLPAHADDLTGSGDAHAALHVPPRASIGEALGLAVAVAEQGPAFGANPRVGCVLLAPAVDGDARLEQASETADNVPRRILGVGWHRGAGSAHAEVDALRDARERGEDVRGATAVVTLEPCAHHGRTPPCAETIAAAGIGEVVFAVDDPNPRASGGAALLRDRGVPARRAPFTPADELVRVWGTAVARGRPYVTLKLATSLDGRVAAADGSSRWITSAESRAHAHAIRGAVDAIAVGSGTALADDPALTARDASGALRPHQPLRVVVGHRDVPATARLRGEGGDLVRVASHDFGDVLAELGAREVRHLLVEGGPTLASAALRAGAVDELHAYVAPVLLGAGALAIADLGISSIRDALRWHTVSTDRLGDDVFVVARPVGREEPPTERTP